MNVLLPVDLKTDTRPLITAAATWASQLAHGGPVTIDLFYVDETPIPVPKGQDARVQAVMEEQARKADAERDRAFTGMLEQLPTAHRGKAHVATGSPAYAIAEASTRYDLVLIGTHQRHGLSRMWLG